MSTFRFPTLALIAFLWLNLGPLSLRAQNELRLEAGAAIVNITPPLGELIVGGFSPLPADDVHDELHVRTIVLTERPTKSGNAIGSGQELDPKHTLAIVVCDNVVSRETFLTQPNKQSARN